MNPHTITLEQASESIDWPVEVGNAFERVAEHLELQVHATQATMPEHSGRLEHLVRQLRSLAVVLDPERQHLVTDEQRAELQPVVKGLMHTLVDFLGR